MKLVTYDAGRGPRTGALVGDGIVDLADADGAIPTAMIPLLEGGDDMLARAAAAAGSARATVTLDGTRLLAPVPRPGKIICIGLNYADHAAESGAAIPDYPPVFSKYGNAVIGHGDPIVLPAVSSEVDYEAELGVVIGRRARHVPESAAMAHVAGYLNFHDVSARDYQMKTSQWTIGKTFDTFAPMGPALVTRDEIPDPHRLRIRAIISGEVLQDSTTAELIFGVPALVAELSSVMTLDPGDVIATGTPPGVGFSRKPPRYLRPGDVARIEIEGLGALENPVVAEAEA